MKAQFLLLLLAVWALSLNSCTKDIIKGTGPTTTEQRTLSSFIGVEINGNRKAEIIPSTEFKVEMTGYKNLVDIIEAKISNGVLYFEYPDHASVKKDNIHLKIYLPSLEHIKLIGNADVTVADGFDPSQLNAVLSGNGELNFIGGTANDFKIESSGNARVAARQLTAKHAIVQLSGNASIDVKATESIDISMSGSGEVHYWGDPANVSVSISGNGHAIKH